MSTNIRNLSARKGLSNNLFERITECADDPKRLHDQAASFLLGDATLLGSASFYDRLSSDQRGWKARVCNGSACLCAGSQPGLTRTLQAHLGEDEVGHVTCLGRCYEGRAFQLHGNNFSGADIDRVGDLLAGNAEGSPSCPVFSALDKPMLTGALPGLEVFHRLFRERVQTADPATLLQELSASQLRGRGGAGFPAGVKWTACRDAPGDKKVVVCNADEGDPGAYIDRYLLEEQPHLVLFGMLCCAWLVGADEAVLYIRYEYPEALRRMESAMAEWLEAGLIGPSVCGTDRSLHMKIIAGQGAYVCGEETALLNSIEGRRPEVNVRPPYPVTEGLYGKPTVVNNVETFACLYPLMKDGPVAFAAMGRGRSTGPKLASLDHLFVRPGLYEVPMGYPFKDLVYKLAGGFRKPVKALQVGGPLGGIVPLHGLDELTFDFESFQDHGFLLGHAGIVCIPEDMSIVAYARHLFEFTEAESCGKCPPCRLGSVRGREMIQDALDGRTRMDRSLLSDLLETMQLGSLCALGGGLPLPILNTLEHFPDEWAAVFREDAP